MSTKIQTAEFKRALGVAGLAVDTKGLLPVLSSVKIQTIGNQRLEISGTNLDLYCTSRCEAKGKKELSAVVSYTLLSRLLARISTKEVSLAIRDKLMVFEAGDVTVEFETLPAEEFPPPLNLESPTEIETTAEEITQPFKRVSYAISTETARYNLTGINLRHAKKGIKFFATNGSTLAVIQSKIECDNAELNVIVPVACVEAITSAFDSAKEPLSIAISPNGIVFKGEQSEVRSKLIEGNFPNCENVIPKPGDKVFSCNRTDLSESISTVSIFLKSPNIHVAMRGAGKQVEIACPQAKAMVLGTELKGQPDFTIRYDPRLMKACLASLQADDVRIECSDDRSPFLIREKGFTAVIAPICPPA